MIGYYGGSFDPIHNGHVEIARYIAAFPAVDSVCFVPTGTHPLGKPVSLPRHRLEMIRLAIRGIPGLTVSDIDVSSGVPSYTIELLRRLKETVKGKFFFIAGMDNLNQLFEWREWQQLLSFPVVFTSRAGIKPDRCAIKRISDIIGKEIPRVEQLVAEVSEPVILTVPDVNISSSQIRKMILKGESPSDMIHLDVLDYIERHDLYRKG
ncbi:MAG: nicotinate (nicotinamide) nucleotide adenylyltransferase [Acidobacteria bacterium]|nr:nicotinate (nicotinamide) nucleotide adenylyltransferase [Acidobacteriota bacterium]